MDGNPSGHINRGDEPSIAEIRRPPAFCAEAHKGRCRGLFPDGGFVSADPSGRNTCQMAADGHSGVTSIPTVFSDALGIFWATFRPDARYFTFVTDAGTLFRSLCRLLFRTETGLVQGRMWRGGRPETMLRGSSVLRRFGKHTSQDIGG